MVVVNLNLDIIKISMETRFYTYDWLRKMYISEPPLELIQELINMAKSYNDLDDSIIEKDFIIFLKDLTKDDQKNINHELKSEFARLFLGPKRLLAPPFESVYLSPRKRMMGEETMEVRQIYNKMGMEVLAFGSLPDDHIGFELEFMYYLCFRVIESINNKDSIPEITKFVETQELFIRDHLIKWVPEFCKDIIMNTNLEFFKELARFTEKFILQEEDTVSNTLDILKQLL